PDERDRPLPYAVVAPVDHQLVAQRTGTVEDLPTLVGHALDVDVGHGDVVAQALPLDGHHAVDHADAAGGTPVVQEHLVLLAESVGHHGLQAIARLTSVMSAICTRWMFSGKISAGSV